MVFFCLTYLANAYCVGLSIGPNSNAVPMLPLQLKNPLGYFITGDAFNRMDWQWSKDSTISITGNTNVSIGQMSDSDLVIRGVPESHLKFAKKFTREIRTLDDQCVTVMQCQRGKLGYCNSDSDDPITKTSEVRHGTYLRLLPCFSTRRMARNVTLSIHPSQALRHYQNLGCDNEKLFNTECDLPCNKTIFANDRSYCLTETKGPTTETTESPSSSPSTGQPTDPVVSLTRRPSAQPSVFDVPTTSPLGEYEIQTQEPTTSPSEEYERSITSAPTTTTMVNSTGNGTSMIQPTGPELGYLGFLALTPFVAGGAYYFFVM
jgi:hypothetical protein